MGSNWRPNRKKRFLTAAQQAAGLKGAQGDSEFCFPKPGLLHWSGRVQPTALCDSYRSRIEYNQHSSASPKVSVLEPKLQEREGKPPPHLYPGGNLCLYLPGSGEWYPYKPIAATILPWASLWLYYYEIWRATGEWLGGGVHPTNGAKGNQNVVD